MQPVSPALAAPAFDLVELRRYAMQPGRRDILIDLFEREFIEAQEALEMTPIGQYRDLDDANSFVWFRGFERMERRGPALDAFYTSPTWLANRDTANWTLVDSDNVLLLHSARPASDFDMRGLTRPAATQCAGMDESFVATSVFLLEGPPGDAFVAEFEAAVLPQLRASAQRIAYLVTDERPNGYPRLPVREGEHAFVVAGSCADRNALAAWCAALGLEQLPAALRLRITSGETLRLEPAARSLFR